MGWCFDQGGDDYTRAVLASLATNTAVVPALWPLEVANVLLVAERRRRLTRSESTRFVHFLSELPVTVDDAPTLAHIEPLAVLARQYALSAYDAAYLHLAMRERLHLATRDDALVAAARAVGVSRFSP